MNIKCRLAIEKYNMLNRGDNVIVGLSGGADSCAMLHFLCSIGDELALKITAVHVNHMIRGGEAERDASFAEEFCRKLGVKFVLYKRDVPKLSTERRQGVEECGRDVRYEIFAREAAKCDGKIATAHTLSDSAETVIFHIIRGCALNGLKGIPPVRGNIIRPLIFCERDDIEAYCAAHNIEYITDSSNMSADYTRNKIRLQILPLMRQINPSASSAIYRLSECAAEDEAYLQSMSLKIAEDYLNNDSANGLFAAAPPIASRALVAICRESLGIIPEHGHISAMLECIERGSGTVNLLSDNIFSVRDGKIKFVRKSDLRNKSKIDNSWFCELFEGEITTPFGKNFSVKIIDRNNYDNIKKIYKNVFQNSLDYDTIKGTAKFRFRNDGDLFRQAGRGNTKSLKKLFNELKVPLNERAVLPILECCGTIAWIYNIGVAEGFQVTESTNKIMYIEVNVDAVDEINCREVEH